jgi:hypothetical protein
MTKPLVLLMTALASVGSVAAIDVPQTREEFVAAITSGRGAAIETFAVERPLDEVYAVLEERSRTCLNVKVERTAYVGYVERSSSEFHPTLRRPSGERAEFTLQVEHHPRGVGHTPPEGGLYMMAADLRASGAGRTEIVLYRPKIGAGKITDSLKQWLSGEPAACPKLR